MDIRFLAIIFLVAALMEMIAKMMRKARAAEMEDVSRPKSVDPLAEVFRELELLPEDEEAPEPVRRESEPGAQEPSGRTEEVGRGRGDPGSESAEGWALPSPASRAGQVVEPVVLAEPVPPPTPRAAPVVPSHDRTRRPVVVRSREFRPREAREIVRRPRTDMRPAPVAARVVPGEGEGVPGRAETRRGGEGDSESGVLGLGSVRGLRRLMVAREVLGPPLALRDEERFPDR